jgi:hypothetical protein
MITYSSSKGSFIAGVYESQQENPRDYFQVTASQLEKTSEAHWRSDIITALVFRVRPTTYKIAEFGFRIADFQPRFELRNLPNSEFRMLFAVSQSPFRIPKSAIVRRLRRPFDH